MYLWKDFKKITTYFNGLITKDKTEYNIRFTITEDGSLNSSMNIDNNTFSFLVNDVDELKMKEFKNISVDYNEFYTLTKSIKGIKKLAVEIINNKLVIHTDNNEEFSINCEKVLTRNFDGESIGIINLESLNYALLLNDNSAKSGIHMFDKNIICKKEDNIFYLNSYNTGIYVGNKIEITGGKNISFLIAYEELSFIKKWLKFVIKPTNNFDDNVELLIFQNYLKFQLSKSSMIIPINFDGEIIAEKYKDLTNYNYPLKKKIRMQELDIANTNAIKEKAKIVDTTWIFETNSNIYRPLFTNVVKQFIDWDLDVDVNVIDSNNLVLEFDSEILDLKTKVLLFAMTPKYKS